MSPIQYTQIDNNITDEISSINSLEQLEQDISDYIAGRESVDVLEFAPFVKRYCGQDWKKHIKVSDEKYQRQTVSKQSNKTFDIHILTWNKNQESKIHDHSENGCIQMILDGTLSEIKYNHQMQQMKKTVLSKDQTKMGYINNYIGYHKVVNESDEEVAISLHIYSPAKYQTTYFEEN